MLYFISAVAMIVLDRISKILAVKYLEPVGEIPLMEGVFHLTYTENTGAAFSIFTGKSGLLAVLSVVVIILLIFFLRQQSKTNAQNRLYLFSIAMIIGGAAGNLIDRAFLGYVIDYFDFTLINFAIFNVADCFITVGAVLFCGCLLFDRKIKL